MTLPNKLPVKDFKSLERDTHSKAVISKNDEAYAVYMKKKLANEHQKAVVERMETKLNTLDDRIGDLEALIRELITTTKNRDCN